MRGTAILRRESARVDRSFVAWSSKGVHCEQLRLCVYICVCVSACAYVMCVRVRVVFVLSGCPWCRSLFVSRVQLRLAGLKGIL